MSEDEAAARSVLHRLEPAGDRIEVPVQQLLSRTRGFRQRRRARLSAGLAGAVAAVVIGSWAVAAGPFNTLVSGPASGDQACASSGGVAGQAPAVAPSARALVVSLYTSMRDRFPNTFTSATIGSDGQVLVYRLPDPALDQAVRTAAGTTSVNFRTAVASFAQMRALQDRIHFADAGYWRSQHLSIEGTLTDDGRLDVAVDKPAKVQKLLDARYGKGLTVAVKPSQVCLI